MTNEELTRMSVEVALLREAVQDLRGTISNLSQRLSAVEATQAQQDAALNLSQRVTALELKTPVVP
jgi:phage shock protein A